MTQPTQTQVGSTGVASPAQPKRRPQSLLSRAVVDSSAAQPAVGMKQTLGA
ncbi:MAG: hypothetical protein IT530_15075 [Burkholderiales bacterium]|nr:hypothetical protein [Burkholderiales bacterium]